MDLVMHPNYFFALITTGFGNFAVSFFYPMLALVLMRTFGLSQSESGFFFCIAPFCAIIVSYTLAIKISDWMTNREVMITSLFIASVGCFCVGPSQIFDLPESLVLVTVGFSITGVVWPLVAAFNFQEMSDVVDIKFETLSEKQKSKLKDFASSIKNTFFELSFSVSILFGEYVSKIVGYRKCCDFVGFACLGVGLLYILLTKNLPSKEVKEKSP